jgi:hypothetical protein
VYWIAINHTYNITIKYWLVSRGNDHHYGYCDQDKRQHDDDVNDAIDDAIDDERLRSMQSKLHLKMTFERYDSESGF